MFLSHLYDLRTSIHQQLQPREHLRSEGPGFKQRDVVLSHVSVIFSGVFKFHRYKAIMAKAIQLWLLCREIIIQVQLIPPKGK